MIGNMEQFIVDYIFIDFDKAQSYYAFIIIILLIVWYGIHSYKYTKLNRENPKKYPSCVVYRITHFFDLFIGLSAIGLMLRIWLAIPIIIIFSIVDIPIWNKVYVDYLRDKDMQGMTGVSGLDFWYQPKEYVDGTKINKNVPDSEALKVSFFPKAFYAMLEACFIRIVFYLIFKA